MGKKEEYAAFWNALCFDALQLRDASAAKKALRAQRLAARRDWELARVKALSSSARECRELQAEANLVFAAALRILAPGGVAAFHRVPDGEIYRFLIPAEAAAEQLDLPAETVALFDGERPFDEIVRIVWAQEVFTPDETANAMENIAARLQKMLHAALRGGIAEKVQIFTWDENALCDALRRGGIVPDDKLMVHASLRAVGQVAGGAATVIAALQRAVGENGIVAMPALSNVCDIPGENEYDPDTTPIVDWIGVLPRIFRKTPGVLRSANPSHSVLAWGRDAAHFIAQDDPCDCFAADGAWAKLRDGNGKILLIGESAVDSNTFLHACEAWYNSYLESVMVRVKGAGKKVETHYPGGCRGNWYHLGKEAPYFQKLLKRNIVRTFRFGEAETVVLEAKQLAEAMKTLFSADPGILLCENNCPSCVKLRAKIRTAAFAGEKS